MNAIGSVTERPIQLRGSRLARGVLRLAGWRVQFDGLPARQGVLIVYPHTSNWDFVIGVLAKWAIGIPLAFWGKDTLFELPLFGRWMRWIGGVPVDRNNPSGAVGAMVGRFATARACGFMAARSSSWDASRSRSRRRARPTRASISSHPRSSRGATASS